MFLFSQAVTGKENKTSADRFRYERTKVPTLAAQTTIHPARRVFGVSNNVNVKGSLLTGRQITSYRSETSGPAQPKLKPVLTRSYTVVSSKSNLNTTSHLKKQSNTGIQSLGRGSSNAVCTAVTKSNSRFSSSSKAAWSCPMKTASARISLGPLVKTKTGLIPAVTQPRNTPSQNPTHTSATATDTITTSSVANKLRSSTSTSVTVSKRSAMAQKKTLPTTALNKAVSEKTIVSSTARVKIKVQDQNKSNSKLLLGKHSLSSCKSQLSSGLKSTSNFSKCTAAPIKPEGRVGMSKYNKSAGQPTDRSTKQRSEREGEKNGQQCKVPPQTSLGPASRYSSRTVTRAMQAAVAERTKTSTQRDSKKGHSSLNTQPQQMGIKRTGAPVTSQTVPRPARTISHTSQATDTKTTKGPTRVITQTERKKQTAAQEERM